MNYNIENESVSTIIPEFNTRSTYQEESIQSSIYDSISKSNGICPVDHHNIIAGPRDSDIPALGDAAQEDSIEPFEPIRPIHDHEPITLSPLY